MGFVNLKSWQEERITIMSMHSKLLQSIFGKTIEKIKASSRESQKMIMYFLSIADQEKNYSDFVHKNIVYLGEIKNNYQNCGKAVHDLCEGIETYEANVAKDKLHASKVIRQIVDETLGSVFKEQVKKTDEFNSKFSKDMKKLHIEEKDNEKAYSNFTTMLEEAEVTMNNKRPYEKDFWLAENQCLITSKKHEEKQRELCKDVIDIWGRCEAVEEVRLRNMKQLYESYFTKTTILSDSSKQLLQIISKTNEDEASSKVYSFKNMFSEDDARTLLHLHDLLDKKIDLEKSNTEDIKQFLLSIRIKDPPQTTFIMKEGILKRDPGFMKSWRDVICIITTEGFFHGFNHRSDKDPVITMNLHKISITTKKDTKFEISEEKKGMFSSHKKISFKTTSLIEMEDWITALKKF